MLSTKFEVVLPVAADDPFEAIYILNNFYQLLKRPCEGVLEKGKIKEGLE